MGGGGGRSDVEEGGAGAKGQQHSAKHTEPSPAPLQMSAVAQSQPQLLSVGQRVDPAGPSGPNAACTCAVKAGGHGTTAYSSSGSPVVQPHRAKSRQPPCARGDAAGVSRA